MPGHELKRNPSRLSSLLKSLPGKAAAELRSPLWHRRAAWAMGGLVLLWVLAYALVPVVLKSQLEKAVFEKLGRQLTVGAVDFRPWSLELTLSDLVIAKAGSPAAPGVGPENSLLSPRAPQLKIARLYIDAEMQSLLRLAPVADAIEVDGLALSLTHLGQGRYDVDDILARLKPPADEPAGNPVRFALYNLVLSDGRLDFADLPAGRTHAVRDLRLSIPFLSNLRSQREVKTSPHLAFKLNGSRFDTAAVGTPFAQTHKTDATLALRGLDLRLTWPTGRKACLSGWTARCSMPTSSWRLSRHRAPWCVYRAPPRPSRCACSRPWPAAGSCWCLTSWRSASTTSGRWSEASNCPR